MKLHYDEKADVSICAWRIERRGRGGGSARNRSGLYAQRQVVAIEVRRLKERFPSEIVKQLQFEVA